MKRRLLNTLLACGSLIVSLALPYSASAQTPVSAGSGSYASSLPTSGVPGDTGYYGPTIADMLSYYQGGDNPSASTHMWLSPSLYSSTVAVPTNRWWEDVVFTARNQGSGAWTQASNTSGLWVYPQLVGPSASGMWIYYPDGYEKREWGVPVSYVNAGPWLQVTDTAGSGSSSHAFSSPNPVITGFGDWTVSYTQTDSTTSNAVITTTLARGVPFTWCQYANTIPSILDNGTLTDINDNPITGSSFTGSAFAIAIRGRTFGVFAPTGTTFTIANGQITPSAAVPYLVYGVLPDAAHLSAFAQYAYAMPTGSQFGYTYNQANGSIDTTWSIPATALSGTNTQVLQGWLPHHYHNTVNNFGAFLPYAYQTPRGALMMTTGNSWTISWKFRGILPMLPQPTDTGASANPFSASEMDNFITSYETGGDHPVYVADSYNEGKELGTAAEFLTMADQMGQSTTKSQILTNLETVLDDWYTYSGSGDDAYFGKLGNYGGLIGVPESFGTAAFNDNHYHYGYFVDASALAGLYDPTWLQNYAPMIELVAKDYANWDRTDTSSPYLREFDPWEGHCWASGYSFNTGQTQESYSESMNAWVGLFTLGNALLGTNFSSTTANAMIAAGAMGYTIEGSAVNEYWQDWRHTNFPDSYGFNGVGTVDAGSIATQVGFSTDPDWTYAVSYLPIAGWQNYQTKDPTYSYQEINDIWNERAEASTEDLAGFNVSSANNTPGDWYLLSGNSQAGEPGDYFMGMQSLIDPVTSPDYMVGDFDTYYANNEAVANYTNPPASDSCVPGLVYYQAHSLRNLGVQDYDYYTSIPTSTVYYNPNSGVRTAVVYNPEATTQTATVYDNGTTVTTISVPSHGLVSTPIGGSAMNTTLAAPTNVAAAAGNGQVTVTWTGVSGASSYDIIRNVSGGGYFFTNVSGSSFTDTGLTTTGQLYSYRVYAVNSEGMSTASNEASVRVYGTGVQQSTDWMYDLSMPNTLSSPGWYVNFNLNQFPYDGVITRVQNDTEYFTYAFPDLTNFNGTLFTYEYPASSVQFFTSVDNGNTWQSLAVTMSGPTAGQEGWNSYAFTPTGTMPANVTNLKIQVPAAGANNWDPEFGPINFTYGGYAAPTAPSGLTAAAGNASVTLSWTPAGGATSYNVYRGTTSGGESTTPIATGVTGSTYTDTSVVNGTTYYYTVNAVNPAGTSGHSNEASATPSASAGPSSGPVSLNCGGSAASPFVADTDFSGGTAGSTTSTVADTYVGTPNPPQAVLQSWRTGSSFTYTLPGFAAGSSATVLLYLMEPTATASGQRQFNVSINGTQVLTNFDLYAATGGQFKAIQENFSTSANSSGQVVISFTSGNAGQPIIEGIAVTGTAGTVTAPSTPTGLAATAGNATVGLTWSASSGATSYNIYRSTTSGGEGTTAYATSASASYTDSSVTNGTTYYYTVAAVNSGGTSSQSTQASATPQAAVPATPTGLAATAGNATVGLTWSASSGATSYNIYRSTTSGGEGTTAYATSTSASYTDSSVTNGTTYYYTVAAVNSAGTSAQSTQASATPQVSAPAVPTGLAATAGSGTVGLAWTASSGATSYNIYRSTTSGGEGTTAYATSTSASYADNSVTNGTTYYYTVAAVNAGGTSAQLTQVSATPSSAPAQTSGPASIDCGGGAASPFVADADYSGGTAGSTTSTVADSYVSTPAPPQAVLQSWRTGSSFTYTLPGFATGTSATVELFFMEPTATASGQRQFNVSINGSTVLTNFDVYAATGGQFKAIQENFGASVNSSGQVVISFTSGGAGQPIVEGIVVTGTAGPTNTAPSTPTGLNATGAVGSIGLSWSASSGATSYNIYRSTTSGGEGSTAYATSTSASYTDTSVTSGTTYYYTVAAVNSYGTSSQSSQASASPLTAPSTPTGLAAAAGNATVGLTWTASSGATSYNIYRSTTSGGEGTTAYATSTSASYTDSSVTNGTKYYYKVAAVNAAGTSAQSTEVSATPQVPSPGAPSSLTATGGNATVALSWTAGSNATSYNIYRSTTSGGEGTTAYATSTSASYTDNSVTNGTTYYYKVASVNSAGTSSQSNEASATPAASTTTSGPASIDCGGGASSPYVADADFSGGTTGSTTSSVADSYVSNPAPPQTVLQSWRTGSSFTYTLGGFTAGSGHTVSLFFMEPTATASGQREFNVAISGSTVLTNFDIYAATGGQFKAIQENFNGTANSSGQIVISFTSGTAGSPIIEGISVPN